MKPKKSESYTNNPKGTNMGTYRRIEHPLFQAYDSNGDPLNGGLVYTYAAGTTTAKATYQEDDTENANPVVLDSTGRAEIYGTGYYKFVLKDSDEVTIWTLDNVQGIGETSNVNIGDYANDFDAAITEIGATETTLYVDSAATMSAAVTVPATCAVIVQKGGSIDQAGNALTFNGPLIMQGGTITNDAALTINGHFADTIFQSFTSTGTVAFGSESIAFRRPEWFYSGSGVYKTAFERAIISNSVVELIGGKTYELTEDGIANTTNITGQDNWTLNGNGAILKFADGVDDGCILWIDDCDDFKISNVEFDGNVSGGSVGHRAALSFGDHDPILDGTTSACNRVIVENCYIHDTQSGAVTYDAVGIRVYGSNDVIVRNNRINNTDVGIIVWRSDNVLISGNLVESGGTSESISIWGGLGTTTNTNINIIGNIVEKQILVCEVDNCVVSGNFSTSGMGIGGESPDGYSFIANDVIVTGNHFGERINIGSQNTGQAHLTANDIVIANNYFDLLDEYGVDIKYKAHGISILNNVVKLAQNATTVFDLIATGDVVSNVVCKGNYVDTNGFTLTYFILSDATPLNISDNYFVGEVTGNGVWITTAAGAGLDDVFFTNNTMPDSTVRNTNGKMGGLINNLTSLATIPELASAATITLFSEHARDDGYFNITGTTNITSITASRAGHVVTLVFAGILTFTDGSNLKLAGSMTTSADDTITLICDGTNWCEISRSVN